MSLYKVEFFDHNFVFQHQDDVEIEEIDDDYLSPEKTEALITLTDKVKTGQFVYIRGASNFFGYVTEVSTEDYQTKVSFEPFVSLFNTDVLVPINRQNKTASDNVDYNLENLIKTAINEFFKEFGDSEWDIPSLNVIETSHTYSYSIGSSPSEARTADSFGLNRCKVNLRDDILPNALSYYGVVINAEPNFANSTIDVRVGTPSGYVLEAFENGNHDDHAAAIDTIVDISADNRGVSIDQFTIDSATENANVLKIFSTTATTRKTYYYLHNDGRSPAYDEVDEARITPVRIALEYAASNTAQSFKNNAKKKADAFFKNLMWNSAIELRITNNDSLIHPENLKIGQICRIWHDGKSYESILTGKKLGNETVLMFGTVRTTLTKQMKLALKKK